MQLSRAQLLQSHLAMQRSAGFNILFLVLVDDGLKMMEDSKVETANSETEDLCCELPLKRQHKYHDEV